MKIKLPLFWMFFLAFSCSNLIYSQTSDTVAYPKNYAAKKEVVYTKVGNWEGRLDVYYPEKTSKPKPLVINIHGGGWNHGTKESQTGFNSFFKNDFVVANIEYRLVEVATAPAAIEDARCSLIYLVNHAKEFNIDVNQIVIMGGSAGGHLALMSGLTGQKSDFDATCEATVPFKIVAIIDKYGITDLATDLFKGKMVQNWLGEKAKDLDFVKQVSPKNWISKNSPAVFIVHGNADTVVPYNQSKELYEDLQKLQVTTEFITIDNGGHGKFTKEENKSINDAMWLFLNKIIQN